MRSTHPLARPELALVAAVLFLDALEAHLLVLRLRHLTPVRPRLRMGKRAQGCSLARASPMNRAFTMVSAMRSNKHRTASSPKGVMETTMQTLHVSLSADSRCSMSVWQGRRPTWDVTRSTWLSLLSPEKQAGVSWSSRLSALSCCEADLARPARLIAALDDVCVLGDCT